MSFFHFVLGLSALNASGGIANTGASAVVNAQVAALNALSNAVASGLIPPPPKAPPAPPPVPLFLLGNSKAREIAKLKKDQHDHAMWVYEREMKHWHRTIAITFGQG